MRKLYSPDNTKIVGILVETIATYTIENVRYNNGRVDYDDPQTYKPLHVAFDEPSDEYFDFYKQRVFVDEIGERYTENELVYEDGTSFLKEVNYG